MNTLITSESVFRHSNQIRNIITGSLADRKRIIAIITPPILIIFMYPIFHLLAGALFNYRIAWYLGLVIYWLAWGLALPLIIIGKKGIKALIRPQKPTKTVILPMSIILLGALSARLLVPGIEYEKQSV